MGKKKNKKKVEEGPPPLTEVDKTFYELQITDIERKITRLTLLSGELIERNAGLEQKYMKLDEDRADVISYLKRTLQEKISEIAELLERLSALQEEKDTEAIENIIKYEQLEEDYRITREELYAEIKKLTGHLNSIEDFRAQKEELYNRYEAQERKIQEKEMAHKRLLYNIEKKFILGKDIIKKETEKYIFDMALEFEEENEKRIAPTTKRVVRENISINNELEIINSSNETLEIKNKNLRKQNIFYQHNNKLLISQRDKALNDAYIQRNAIKQLKEEYNKITYSLEASNMQIQSAKYCEKKLNSTLQKEYALNYKLRTLEQNLHASQCQKKILETELQTVSKYIKKYRGSIYEAVMNIKSAMKIQSLPEIEYVKIYEGENILVNLLFLLVLPDDEGMPVSSLPSVQSLSANYDKGDLGFMPAMHDENRRILYTGTESGIGPSFEDFVKMQVLSSYDKYAFEEASIIEESDEEKEEFISVSKAPSVVTKLPADVSKISSVARISSVAKISSTVTFPTEDDTLSESTREPSVIEAAVVVTPEEVEEIYETVETEEQYGEIDEELDEHQALIEALEEGNNLGID